MKRGGRRSWKWSTPSWKLGALYAGDHLRVGQRDGVAKRLIRRFLQLALLTRTGREEKPVDSDCASAWLTSPIASACDAPILRQVMSRSMCVGMPHDARQDPRHRVWVISHEAEP